MAASAIGGGPVIRIVAQGGGAASTQQITLPTVTTLDPVCTAGTATVNALLYATADARGAETTVMFRYKPVGGASIASQPFDLPAAFGAVSVSVEVQGLTASTAYSVTAFAWHKYGIFGGISQSGGAVLFDTPAVSATSPPRAVTEAPLVIGSTTATIHGRVNPLGETTGYYFTLTGPGGAVVPTDPLSGALTGTSFIDVEEQVANLQPDTDYTYTLTAENVYGQSASGLPVSFRTDVLGGVSAPTVEDPTLNFVTDSTAQVRVFFDTGGDTCLLTVYGTVPLPVLITVAPTETFRDVLLQFLSASTAYNVIAKIENTVGEDTSGTLVVTTSGATSAPEGDTQLPEKIGQNVATLRALFDPNLLTTTVTFYYAKSLAELSASPQSIDASATSALDVLTEFRARISGSYVQPYTLYYYYAKAVNSAGTATGQVVTFRTGGAAATTICTVTAATPATYVTDTAMTMTGTLTHWAYPTSYYFEWWLTGFETTTKKFTTARIEDFPIGTNIVGLVSTVSERIYGLTANTGYTYRLVAVNAGDQLHQTSTPDRTQTTAAAPVAFPATGTVGYATVISATSVSVGGTVNTLGSDTDVRAEASTTRQFTAIAAFSATSTFVDSTLTQAVPQLAITGLTTNTLYYFRLRYVNDGGVNTSYSYNWTTATTSGLGLPTLGATSETNVTANSFNVQLNVTLPSDIGTDLVYVWVEYGTATGVYGSHTVHQPMVDQGGNPLPAGVYQQNVPLSGLTANTAYYYRVGARRAGVNQYVFTSEDNRTTSAGSTGNPSVITVQAARVVTPYSFHMHGDLDTNGDSITVTFEYWCTTLGETSASPRVTTAQVISDSAYTVKVADHTTYLPGPAFGSTTGYAWQYQIKTVAGGSTNVSDVMNVVCPAPTEEFPQLCVNQGTGFIDAQSARPRSHLKHRQGKRVFMYLEIAESAADLTSASGTYERGRWVSYIGPTNTVTKPDGTVVFPECHYSQKFDNLTENTTYHWRCVAWSALGIHTGPISTFTTDVLAGNWSANWAASVGSRLPARNLAGPVPKDLRLGTGTRTYPTSSTDTASGVVWGADDYDAGTEIDYTILVTPTSVTCLGTHPGTDLTRDDTNTNSNIAYAFRQARIGDIIRVEGYNATTGTGHAGFSIYYTSRLGSGLTLNDALSVGATYQDAAGTYTARCTHASSNQGGYCFARFRLLTGSPLLNMPQRGVVTNGVMAQGLDVLLASDLTNGAGNVEVHQSGPYTYSGPRLGDGTNNASAYWGAATRKPITGVRVQANAAAAKYCLTGVDSGNSEGGANGVFFRDAIFDHGPTPTEYLVDSSGGPGNGVGVLGIYRSEFRSSGMYHYNWGLKTPIRLNCPVTQDMRNNTYNPSNEHFDYCDGIGYLGNGDSFICDNTITGTSGDGLKTYNQRSHVQIVCRGDVVQGGATGSGYAPGEGNVYILRGTHRGGNNAGMLTPWGHFGHIYVDGCSHLPIPTTAAAGGYVGAESRQFLVSPDDTSKGMWMNERGFATEGLHIGTLSTAGNTSSVNNADANFYGEIRNCQVVEIGHFTFAVTPNNKPLFKFMESTARDNGTVTFSGTYPTGLLAYPNWPAQSAVPLNNRMLHGNVPITAVADYTRLETEGYQYVAMQ